MESKGCYNRWRGVVKVRWDTVCFDLDNTLYSHEKAFEQAIQFCYKQLLHKWEKEGKAVPYVEPPLWFSVFKQNCDKFWNAYEEKKLNAKAYRRLRYRETMLTFQLPYKDTEADEFHQQYYNIVDEFSEPFAGLYTLLSMLNKQNVKSGIITNGSLETQYKKMKKLKLHFYIPKQHIFISEEVGFAKPDVRLFQYAERKMNSIDRPLYVGDTWEHDVIGAINAGWDVVYLNTRNEVCTSNHRPVQVCTSLHTLKEFICIENGWKG